LVRPTDVPPSRPLLCTRGPPIEAFLVSGVAFGNAVAFDKAMAFGKAIA